jgi:protocatechuate 3,4-dioxygenase beta subunit
MKIPRTVLLVILLVATAAICLAQAPAKESTASIAGHVTFSGKAAAGVTVVATLKNSFFDNKTVGKTTTDEDGNYKLTGVPAGNLTIMPLAKACVVASGSSYKEPGQSFNVTEGETITKIDFALVRGGVVTGRITDAEGHPLIGERVSIVTKDSAQRPESQMYMLGGTKNQTDDRGIYRVYGLGPGSYKVSVGQASASGGGAATIMGMGGSQYLKTYYPGVEDETKATIIEIKEGTEVKNVDISVNKPGSGFAVSGRVIDAESGAPVANVYIGHSALDQSGQQVGGMNFTGNQSDTNGKFRLEGLRPGRYSAYTIAAGQDQSNYSEPVTFEVADGDVTGIEIKVRRGATINGVAVVENNSDPAVAALLQTVSLYAYVEKKDAAAPSYSQSSIAADGSFHMSGLAPGRARLGMQGFPAPPKGLTLLRTEIDGLDQKEGIELAQGGQINGVRLLFAYGTGSVRGDVKLEGGELPQGMSLQVVVRSVDGDAHRFRRQAEVDARLHFLVENIPPGNYELVVTGATPMNNSKPGLPVEFLKQRVAVANGSEVKVNLVVNLAATHGDQP